MTTLIRIVILIILILLPFVSNGAAASNQLQPKHKTDAIFQEVTYKREGELEHIQIKGTKMPYMLSNIYDIEINAEEGTYNIINSVQQESIPFYAGISNYTAWVQATTKDPLNISLCTTRTQLSWENDGTTLTFQQHSLTPWAAFPSALGTHWYIDTSTLFEPVIGNGNITQKGYAGYYNYDFGFPNRKVEAKHWITITGKENGSYDYTVDWERSGEGWFLLHLRVEIS
ncbi:MULTISPECIES: hypothetical protein [Bacillus]|uniref:hypothetical protein n=1 Tax=Bacillus TaxID=1386 RepID=UPI00077ADA57|nr:MULTISPECIES: hypothetical protein [Bacillus cereus group]KXY82737.1 hypothetical protein AT270_30730 [Bacillus cereus]MBG9938033.1 hypothetical protein [Bacillus tropicus]MED2997315.1 hypothetical protein [Bacillus tropicus]OTY53246.1 hypothetical protein BK748_18390 [Bacillus thuringiensis serovar graciosensis]